MKGSRFVLTAVVITIILAMIPLVEASPGAKIALSPSDVRDLDPGALFTVDVTMTDASDVYGWQVNLTFTPGALSVVEVTEGTFFEGFDATVWPTPKIRNDAGFVLFSASLWPPYPPQGVDGTGLLATIGFKVESEASSALHFDSRGTYLRTVVEGNMQSIEDFTVQDGSFTGSGATWWSELPLVMIAAVLAVVVIVIAVVFLLRRRRQ